MPMRVIAKKRCRAMFEPPGKGERVTPDPNLSTRLNLLFPIRPLGGGLAVAGVSLPRLHFNPNTLKLCSKIKLVTQAQPRRLDTLSNVLSDVRFGSSATGPDQWKVRPCQLCCRGILPTAEICPSPCDKLARRANFGFSETPNQLLNSGHPVPARGAVARRHERGMGCGGRGSVGVKADRRAGFP
jgi:hypothetical protein